MTKIMRKKTPSQKVAVKEITAVLKCRRKRFDDKKEGNDYLLIFPMLKVGYRHSILKLGVVFDLIDDRFSNHVSYKDETIEEYYHPIRRKTTMKVLVIRIKPKE